MTPATPCSASRRHSSLVVPDLGGPAIDLARHSGLVHMVALRLYRRRMRGRNLPTLTYDDLVAAGQEGLWTGAQRFDHTRGFSEATYLLHWVRHAIGRAWQDHRSTVRVPVHFQEKASRGELDPTEALVARSVSHSLDAPVGDEGRAWHEMFPDAEAVNPEDAAEENDLHDELTAAIDALPERHRFVMRSRMRERTLLEIGEELGCSRERVRQLESEAVQMLGAAVRGEHRRARELWRQLHAARRARPDQRGRKLDALSAPSASNSHDTAHSHA